MPHCDLNTAAQKMSLVGETKLLFSRGFFLTSMFPCFVFNKWFLKQGLLLAFLTITTIFKSAKCEKFVWIDVARPLAQILLKRRNVFKSYFSNKQTVLTLNFFKTFIYMLFNFIAITIHSELVVHCLKSHKTP